jgi:GTP-binding protein
VLETIDKVAAARRMRVSTPALNKFIEQVTAANPPVSPGRKHVRIMYAAQIGVAPPSFVFFTNVATTFHFSYERFLINKLREEFGFVGSPIRIQVRRRNKNTNVGGTRKRPVRHDAKARAVQREREDRRSRKNRRDKKEG